MAAELEIPPGTTSAAVGTANWLEHGGPLVEADEMLRRCGSRSSDTPSAPSEPH
jgi:hypothetical protein